MSRNSKCVDDAADASVLMSVTVVVAHEKLVGEDRCRNLCPVVFDSTMPYTRLQFEQRFEPLIEWLDGLLATGVNSSAACALEESLALATQGAASRAAGIGVATFRSAASAVPRIFGTQESASRSPAATVKLDAFSQSIRVISAIGRDCLCGLRQMADLPDKAARLLAR